MFEDDYNNSTYWVDIHQGFTGQLRAVGWPTLCEEFNKLKYASEQASFLEVFARAIGNVQTSRILEIGVGIGYWTALQTEYCRKKGIACSMTALDISPLALELVKARFPGIETLSADLKTIPLDQCREQYDVVSAIMVLLHLTDVEDYRHALQFCASSVKKGGRFILYEPLLDRNYSPFNSLDYDSFTGNSIPRTAALVDNIMRNLGLRKVMMVPGASWLLNSPIQGNSKMAFWLKQRSWLLLTRLVFKNDSLTHRLSRLLLGLDRSFKRANPDSGSFVLYEKVS